MINSNSKYAQAFIGKELYEKVAVFCKKHEISQARFYGFCIEHYIYEKNTLDDDKLESFCKYLLKSIKEK